MIFFQINKFSQGCKTRSWILSILILVITHVFTPHTHTQTFKFHVWVQFPFVQILLPPEIFVKATSPTKRDLQKSYVRWICSDDWGSLHDDKKRCLVSCSLSLKDKERKHIFHMPVIVGCHKIQSVIITTGYEVIKQKCFKIFWRG